MPTESWKIKDDGIILTLDIPEDPRERYLLGGKKRKIRRVLLQFINDGKVFYATNSEGVLFKNFINSALVLERNPSA